jgi:hypothetical protein
MCRVEVLDGRVQFLQLALKHSRRLQMKLPCLYLYKLKHYIIMLHHHHRTQVCHAIRLQMKMTRSRLRGLRNDIVKRHVGVLSCPLNGPYTGLKQP